MRKLSFILTLLVLLPFTLGAANPLNSKADSVLGVYLFSESARASKIEVTKNADGTYDCTVIAITPSDDPSTGKPWCDVKNPDKAARSKPCVGLKIIKGLKYDPSGKCWGGTRIYDPKRGISANVRIFFEDDGRLNVRGTVLAFGETVHWTRTRR